MIFHSPFRASRINGDPSEPVQLHMTTEHSGVQEGITSEESGGDEKYTKDQDEYIC